MKKKIRTGRKVAKRKKERKKKTKPYAKQFVLFTVLRCYRSILSVTIYFTKCSTKQIGCDQLNRNKNSPSKTDIFCHCVCVEIKKIQYQFHLLSIIIISWVLILVRSFRNHYLVMFLMKISKSLIHN